MKKIICFILCLLSAGCVEDYNSNFPEYQVNFHINLNTEGLSLVGIGGYYVKDKIVGTERIGYAGVLVYHTYDTSNSYAAFDRACPVEAARDCLISTPDDIGIVKCKKCGSTFNISYGIGNPESGPAVEKKRILRKYRTTLSGTILSVYN